MTIFVMAIEFSGPSKRVFSGTLISAIYSSSQVLAGILAMNFHNFRVFLQVLFVPNFLVLTFIWLVPESVRWLVTKGKLRRARQILMRAAKLNGVEISQHNKDMLYEQHEIKIVTGSHTIASAATTNTSVGSLESEPPTSSFRFAFQSSSLILRLLNCLFCWLANSFIYYGMNINSVSLAGNKYVNYIFVNLVEVPAVYLASYLMEKFGRKKVLCICLLINGVACVATEFIAKDDHVGRLTMYIIGKCGVTISFTVLYVFSSELFPTSIRHCFMNACSSAGSVGSIIAPFTPLLVIRMLVNVYKNSFITRFFYTLGQHLVCSAASHVWRVRTHRRTVGAAAARDIEHTAARHRRRGGRHRKCTLRRRKGRMHKLKIILYDIKTNNYILRILFKCI